MTITISKAYIKTFEQNVIHLAQQSVSRLRNFVTEKNQTSSSNSWGRIASEDMASKASARTATPEADTEWSNRIATVATYHIGDTTEPEDSVQMAMDPNSALVRTFAAAANRQIDDLIIAAASAVALDEAGATPALPSASKIGDATTEFTFDLVTQVVENFLEQEVGPEIPKCFVVSPNCVRKMMNWTEFTSADFTNVKVLATSGFLPNWMGFTWIVSNRLAVPAGLQRKCLAFSKQALGLLVAKDTWTEIAKDPSKSFLTRFYAALTMGCVRVQDEHITEVHILES